MKPYILTIFLMAFVTVNPAAMLAQEVPIEPEAPQDYIQITESGSINWESGTVNATGNGTVPTQALNAAQANAIAIRLATVIARRNLLTTLQGIRIDSKTTVQDFMGADDTATDVIRGLLQNSPILDTSIDSNGKTTVTVAVELRNDLARVLLPKPKPFVPVISQLSQSIPENFQTPEENVPSESLETSVEPPVVLALPAGDYTGVIIDARGLGIQPALCPRVLDENGQVLYGPNLVDSGFSLNIGMAGYVHDMEAAMRNARAGSNPILFYVKKAAGTAKTDMVLDSLETQRFQLVAEQSYVKECRVMIVLD